MFCLATILTIELTSQYLYFTMPRQGGQGKGKPKLKDRGFGKSIIRKQATGLQGLYNNTFCRFISAHA